MAENLNAWNKAQNDRMGERNTGIVNKETLFQSEKFTLNFKIKFAV